MYENLRGKTLLVMDRTALAACAVMRAKEMGIRTIVANFYKLEDSPSKQVADIAIDIDISNIDAMVALIKKFNIDGIFVGWTDSHLPFYAKICEKAGLPSIGTFEQFNILSNDKLRFKETCNRYGVPTPKSFNVDISFKREDLDKIEYPVMVKQADGSGGRGIKRCNDEDELIKHYKYLYENSVSKKIVCEQFIQTNKEIFLNYTIQNGYCSLSASYMCFETRLKDGSIGPAILHVYPSSYTELYQSTVESRVVKMFEGLGIKNGILSLQGFVTDDNKFVFHETGLRMGGGQSYVFTNVLNGVSALDLMIEYSVTGQMEAVNLKEKDEPLFSKPCVNYYISLNSGIITEIQGLDKVRNMHQVLQISQFHKIGDKIQTGASLDSVIFRLHVIDGTADDLARTLETISKTLRILDQDGKEMQLEPLSYQRAFDMITSS